MKLNLPSKNKKLISLSLLGLVVPGVKMGENFRKCLIANEPEKGAKMYNSLIDFNFSALPDFVEVSSTTLGVCLDKTPFYLFSVYDQSKKCSNAGGIFPCGKINSTMFCSYLTPSTIPICAGILGDTLITKNYNSSGAICPDIQKAINYLTTTTTTPGYELIP